MDHSYRLKGTQRRLSVRRKFNIFLKFFDAVHKTGLPDPLVITYLLHPSRNDKITRLIISVNKQGYYQDAAG